MEAFENCPVALWVRTCWIVQYGIRSRGSPLLDTIHTAMATCTQKKEKKLNKVKILGQFSLH